MNNAAFRDLLADLEAEIHHPGRTCTRQRLEQILAPAFHEVGRSGAQYSREQVITFLLDRGTMPSAMPFNHRVHQVSSDVAILSYETDEGGQLGTRKNPARRASVWRHGEGGWQLTYHQATPAADPLPLS